MLRLPNWQHMNIKYYDNQFNAGSQINSVKEWFQSSKKQKTSFGKYEIASVRNIYTMFGVFFCSFNYSHRNCYIIDNQ